MWTNHPRSCKELSRDLYTHLRPPQIDYFCKRHLQKWQGMKNRNQKLYTLEEYEMLKILES